MPQQIKKPIENIVQATIKYNERNKLYNSCHLQLCMY